MNIQKANIVVLIPCLNEEITIGKVIRDFQKSIPEAQIIVFDNNSTDRTASIALESGAEVIKELVKILKVSTEGDSLIMKYSI